MWSFIHIMSQILQINLHCIETGTFLLLILCDAYLYSLHSSPFTFVSLFFLNIHFPVVLVCLCCGGFSFLLLVGLHSHSVPTGTSSLIWTPPELDPDWATSCLLPPSSNKWMSLILTMHLSYVIDTWWNPPVNPLTFFF